MSTPDTEKRRFEQWLSRQTRRDDRLGELARHTQELGFEPDLMERCRRHHRNAHRESHLDRSLPVLGMRQAWEGWSAENLRELQLHWPAVLAMLKRMENPPKLTWLPNMDEHPFPNGRKVRVEADGEGVVLRFQHHEDWSMWRRGDDTARVETALRQVIGRPVQVSEEV